MIKKSRKERRKEKKAKQYCEQLEYHSDSSNSSENSNDSSNKLGKNWTKIENKNKTEPNTNLKNILKLIYLQKKLLLNSQFYAKLNVEVIPKLKDFGVMEIVAYGIGMISESRTSQLQFAFLLLLMEELGLDQAYAFDPVSNEHDKEVYSHYGMSYIDKNENGCRVATEKTLFYMPHCEGFLYESVLVANKTEDISNKCFDGWKKLAIVGNNFSEFLDKQSVHKISKLYPNLDVAKDIAQSSSFPDEEMYGKEWSVSHHPFNDTSLIMF
ncbi:hypothetical protein BB559_004123 [Furculomyces boomerangus]|uniref:SRR1-like domain-containing protein n=2 Tax=Harpellales TaxID=61421 RepID=A0A2T9YGL0_9FUNG|nr:hypothetical protein BB559_004123 [Furculomyces boomerangus]PWA01512.1 hypothetical protein BB558_002392 [Smittium angustum]